MTTKVKDEQSETWQRAGPQCCLPALYTSGTAVQTGTAVLQSGTSAHKASDWLGVLKQHCADLEVGLAQEHQSRVCQEREKVYMPCSLAD